MQYCKKCIMPERFPGISFNAEGVCNLCLDYKPYHRYWGKEKLVEVLKSGLRAGKYDCVVPMSGGKDSTFILYYAVRELGLHPIAVSYDSGFQTPIAAENMRNACRILNVQLVVVKSPGDIQSKLLRESLLVSQKLGYLTDFCGNCEAIIRMVAMNTATIHGVPFVLWGSSALETLTNEDYEEYRRLGESKKANPLSFLSKVWAKFNVLLEDPRKISRIPQKIYPYIGYHSIKYSIYSIRQRLLLHFPIRYALKPHSIPPLSETNPKVVHFFDYIPWDAIRNVKILEDELDWKHPIDRESRFDCSIHHLANLQYLRRYGISHDGVNFCQFIRENKMSREEVMAKENNVLNSVDRECQELLDRIGLQNYRVP